MSFTPGPWTVAGPIGYIYTAGDPYKHGPMLVGQVRGWGHLTGQGACAFDEEKAVVIQNANARLIACAPELLAALEALTCDDDRCDEPACKAGRAAIAKAKGRS